MNILQFIASDDFGGAEKVFVELSNELSKQHNVIALVIRGTNYTDRFAEAIQIHQIKAHPTSHNPLLPPDIFRIIRKYKPDIIHTHGDKATMLINRLKWILSTPHLATKHNSRKGRIFNKIKWVSTISKKRESQFHQLKMR